MAFKNKLIQNPKTGQSIRFLQTAKDNDDNVLEMEAVYRPYSIIPAEHFHPYQEEDFYVLKGELTIRVEEKLRILRVGESIHIRRNIPHAMWNQSGRETIIQWKVYPAMQTEYLLETMFGLAGDNKTNEKGMPPFLQTILIAKQFSDVMRLSKPPYAVQKVLFGVLAPVAVLFGFKPLYRKYLG